MVKQKPVKQNTLLSLSTIAPDPQFVQIDDATYELKLIDQLGIKEQARLGAMASRAEAIKMTSDLTDEVIDELIEMYRNLVKAVMPTLPAEVLETLTIQHLQAIIVVFTEASGIEIPAESLEEK